MQGAKNSERGGERERSGADGQARGRAAATAAIAAARPGSQAGVAHLGASRWSLLGLGLLSGLIFFTGEPSAHGFVRSRTRSCQPVFWPQSCLYIQPDGDLLGDDLAPATVVAAIQSGVQAWNDHLEVSSFLQLRYLAPRGPQEVNPLDGLQLLKFRRDRWCRPPTATTSMQVCFDQSATAVTTVTFINRPTDPTVDGRIIDADIDFNAVNFRFYNADEGLPGGSGGRSPVDLWNTVTHELGHVMGLEHPCSLFPGALAECVVDDQGVPVPDCSVVEQDRYRDLHLQTIYESTMYPTSAPGETNKRLPHADDVAGIITAYPKVKDPMTCRLPLVAQNAGCAAPAAAAVPSTTPLLAGALLALLAALRTLRRRGRP